MEGSRPDDDEVIADSEDDDTPFWRQQEQLTGFGVHPNPIANETPAAIHDCEGGLVSINAGSLQGQQAEVENHVLDMGQDLYPNPLSIADRAKTRRRNTKSKNDNITPTSSASNNQSRERTKSAGGVIELSSDEDELNISSKSKPKPKPLRKTLQQHVQVQLPTPQTPHSPTLDGTIPSKLKPRPRPIAKQTISSDIVPPPRLTDPASQEGLPMLTSSATPIPFNLITSPLPPSDPPIPTSTATNYDIPHIETLPNHPVTEFDAPPSSPSSLFSVDEITKGSRKHQQLVDELESDDVIQGRQAKYLHMMPPPPTFFAGSSSPTADAGVITSPAQDVLDLTMLIPVVPAVTDLNTIAPKNAKKVANPRKPRKKKDIDDYEDVDEARTARPKAKAKPRSKPKKQLEVVIEKPGPTAKRKGKGKATEVFKSNEYVDDDDMNEEAVVPPVAVVDRSPPVLGHPRRLDSLSSLTSEINSDREVQDTSTSSRKRKVVVDGDEGNEVEETPPCKKSRGKQKEISTEESEVVGCKPPKRKGRTKKTVAVLSEDESDWAAQSLSTHQAKAPDKAEKRTRNKRVQRDEPAEDDLAINSDATAHSSEKRSQEVKENVQPSFEEDPKIPVTPQHIPKPPKDLKYPRLSSRYTIAPKTKSTPMTELIRRVNSLPGSPFPASSPKNALIGTAYSPYLKSSRSLLSRIAPLHQNRRTPPPPLPPLPPRRKTKKEMEMEEMWETELIESVGGILEWEAMDAKERKILWRTKKETAMARWEED